MRESIKIAIAFVTGAAASAVALHSYFKSRYESDLALELENTRAYYEAKYAKKAPEKKPEKESAKNPRVENRPKVVPITEAKDICSSHGYIDYSQSDDTENGNIEYIAPDEYGDGDYDVIELKWREGSRTMVDDKGFRMDNWPERVGDSFVAHFGEYVDDEVFVRNHEMKTDYLIELEVDEETNE